MDYDKRFDEMTAGSGDVWKPTPGIHKVKILEEPTETAYISPIDGKETPQIKVKVEVKGKEMSWYISQGLTFKSVYGQLMGLGVHKGKLAGETITLSVASTKNRDGTEVNSYQVIEAIEILPELTKPKEEKVE